MKRKVISPIEFIDRAIKLNEKGEPWSLSAYQRRVLELAFRRDHNDNLLYRLILLSEVKKSGKTFLAACLVIWWAITNRSTEIILTSNDLEQSIGRVFKTVTALIENNEALSREADVLSSVVR